MFADFIFEITATAGTGPFTLGGARSADFRRFSQGYNVGDVVPYSVYGGGQFEVGEGTLTSANTLARTTVFNGSAGPGVAVDFATGNKDIFSNINSGTFKDISSLDASGTLADGDRVLVLKAGGALSTILGSIFKASGSGTAAPDTVAPSAPTGLASSNVTATSFTVTFTPGTDNVGVQRSEWSLDGTSWTALTAGATSFAVTGRTASTSYTARVRTVDTSGNASTAATLPVTTSAPSGDTTAPAMSGSITTSGVTQTGFTMGYSAGSDNVAVARYEVSTDGGTNWLNNALNLSYTKSDAVAATAYGLRARAYDAAGNVSNVLTGTVTTNAATPAAPAYVLTPDTNGFPTAPQVMTSDSPDRTASFIVKLYVKTADGQQTPGEGNLKFVWGKSPTTPPMAYADAHPAIGVNGNQLTHQTDNVAPNKIGYWVNPGDNLYGLYTSNGYLNPWGTPGNWYLWVLTADGYAKAYDNGTGTPIAWVLQA